MSASREAPPFRLDNERLAFRFTATLSDRSGRSVERLPTARRLDDWLTANKLRLDGEAVTDDDLNLARGLREAVHRAGTAITAGIPAEPDDVALINDLASRAPSPALGESGLCWIAEKGNLASAGLGLIARDAVLTLGGDDRNRIKACENPDCGGLYVDTSQGRNRRWCSMNICGNRAKKAKFRHGRTDA